MVILTKHFRERLEERFGLSLGEGTSDEAFICALLDKPDNSAALEVRSFQETTGPGIVRHVRHVALRFANKFAVAVILNNHAVTVMANGSKTYRNPGKRRSHGEHRTQKVESAKSRRQRKAPLEEEYL